MSSSNLVSVVYTPETDYGEKPTPIASVVMETARYTSESLSGTPLTTESAIIRTDRMSSGQVATGLEVGGAIDFELAPGKFYDDFFSAAMMNDWVVAASASMTIDLTPDPADDQKADLSTTDGDFSALGPGVVVSDVLQLVPPSGAPIVVSVITVTDTANLVVATMRGQAAIVATLYDVEIPQHLVIGKVQKSMVIGKTYTDVDHLGGGDLHSQTYTGSLVSGFNVSAVYGEIVSGNYSTMGNGYVQEAPSYEQQVIAGGGTVNPAGTTLPLNASIDVPLVTSDGVATSFCIEQFTIDLDNGLDPTTCLGKEAPTGYTLGTAAINTTSNIYLSDTAYDAFMSQKLSQAPVSLTFTMENEFGGYAFSMPAVQLSFPDPAATGQNEQTMIEGSGVAKVGPNGESALKIWKLVGVQP